jgi:D-serine deaminase-like pyridoxal phosphate-dependent protein
MPTFQGFQASLVDPEAARPIRLDEPIALDALPTPALIIDLDVFDANLDLMGKRLAAEGLGLRAHGKMHKCPIIARRQLDAGAVGICTATVSEAEVMVASGIDDVLITSPVVTDDKIARVMTLAGRSASLKLVVDHAAGAERVNAAAAATGVSLTVLVDLDPGMGRTGIETGEAALTLVELLESRCDNLQFGGLQMYAGNCMHIHGFGERRAKYLEVMQTGLQTRDLIVDAGVEVPICTGGGTGSFDLEGELGLMTDIQAGSYAFMDVEYREIGGTGPDGRETSLFETFSPSLFVMVTAISQPKTRMITVDAGYKAFASDTVKPAFANVEGVRFHWGGDEHGMVSLDNPSRMIELGDRLPMITSHCDPTVNLYDYYYPVRDGVVEEVWPIAARGRSQ